ncbi:hypothetical protein MRB53_036158 [Persea americana]|uniref:Uncharacterized protein n=1 Tax=Persea americana TaxID=3435 RepID=A0ACC2K6Q5_PERAE|nr:hypothetical protein MRB53_036158 [Persea americana]
MNVIFRWLRQRTRVDLVLGMAAVEEERILSLDRAHKQCETKPIKMTTTMRTTKSMMVSESDQREIEMNRFIYASGTKRSVELRGTMADISKRSNED